MKDFALVFALGMIFSTVSSQDLVVTSKEDSIYCKISKIDTDYLYFTFRSSTGIDQYSQLPIDQVVSYERKYFARQDALASGEDPKGIVMALYGGYAYRTAKISPDIPYNLDDYVKSLKSGYSFGGDLTYFFSESLGIGVKYTQFRTSGMIENIRLPDGGGGTSLGTIEDNIFITFIGPALAYRLSGTNNKNALVMNLGIGYVTYLDDGTYFTYLTLEGNTIGMVLDLGYEIGLSDNFALGFQASTSAGVLTEYVLSNGSTSQTIELEKEQYEGLGRVDLSVRLKYRF
ncbi:MAG: hypothetical protein ABFS32_22980 [Bacteroidota bacterium]